MLVSGRKRTSERGQEAEVVAGQTGWELQVNSSFQVRSMGVGSLGFGMRTGCGMGML